MPAGGRSAIDYTEAERRFVVEGKSIRAIAKELGLRSWSSMANIAKREDWIGKRQAYMNSIARRSYENAAAAVAGERAAVQSEAILAGRLTLRAYIDQLAKKEAKITPRDAQLWAAFLMAEMADGGRDTSSEVPDVRNITPPDTDLLRRVVEAARGRVAPAGSLGAAALVEPANPRPD